MIYKKNEQRQLIKSILDTATDCLIFTGAGMGVDSGLSVFRTKEGLWAKYPEAGANGLGFQELANPLNYQRYPDVVVPFYVDRWKQYRETQPHEGFDILRNYVESLSGSYFAVTSNVDGHLAKAGFSKLNTHGVQGDIELWQCSGFSCARKAGKEGLFDISAMNTESYNELRCDRCGELLRPNLLQFYDMDWMSDIYDEQEARYNQYLYSQLHGRRCGKVLVIEIGAGSDIRTIRSMAEMVADDLKTKLIRINPAELESSESADPNIINLKMGALDGIKKVFLNSSGE